MAGWLVVETSGLTCGESTPKPSLPHRGRSPRGEQNPKPLRCPRTHTASLLPQCPRHLDTRASRRPADRRCSLSVRSSGRACGTVGGVAGVFMGL